MYPTGIIGAAGEIIIRSSATSDKFAAYLGFAAQAVTGGFEQMAEDGSDKATTKLGTLKNKFININGQTCEITRLSFIGSDYALNLSCNSSDLSQTDISSVQTNLGTLSQSDVLSFSVAGDASAGHRVARWSWRVGTNGVSSGQLVPANAQRSYVIINR